MSTAASFNALLLEHLPRLRPYAMSLTRNYAAAEDLLQDAAFNALRGHAQFIAGTNFRAWMTRIVRNSFISSLRRARRIMVPIDDVPEHALTLPADQEHVVYNGQVVQAISQLDDQQREVVELICNEGLSYVETAATIDCAIGTVKSRLWRARRQLNVLLSDRRPTAAAKMASCAHPYSISRATARNATPAPLAYAA